MDTGFRRYDGQIVARIVPTRVFSRRHEDHEVRSLVVETFVPFVLFMVKENISIYCSGDKNAENRSGSEQ